MARFFIKMEENKGTAEEQIFAALEPSLRDYFEQFASELKIAESKFAREKLENFYIEHGATDGQEDWYIYDRAAKEVEDRWNGPDGTNGLTVYGIDSAEEAQLLCAWLNSGKSLRAYYEAKAKAARDAKPE